MNKLADAIKRMSSVEGDVDLQALSSTEKAALSDTKHILDLQTEELTISMEQKRDAIEWYSPITPSEGSIPEN
jgi:hypothetical protein